MNRLALALTIAALAACASPADAAIGFNEQYINTPGFADSSEWNASNSPAIYHAVGAENASGVVRLAVRWGNFDAAGLAQTISDLNAPLPQGPHIPLSHIIVDWYGIDSSPNIASYANFVANWAHDHPANPVEVWNEPNLPAYGSLDADTYTTMVNHTYNAVQAADPGHKVWGGSVSVPPCGTWYSGYLTDVFTDTHLVDPTDAGAINPAVGTSVHVYLAGCGNANNPDHTNYWPENSKGRQVTNDILDKFEAAREGPLELGNELNAQYAITEIGFSSTDPLLCHPVVGNSCPDSEADREAKQATYGANMFLQAKARGVDWVMWHRPKDAVDPPHPVAGQVDDGWGVWGQNGIKPIAAWLHA